MSLLRKNFKLRFTTACLFQILAINIPQSCITLNLFSTPAAALDIKENSWSADKIYALYTEKAAAIKDESHKFHPIILSSETPSPYNFGHLVNQIYSTVSKSTGWVWNDNPEKKKILDDLMEAATLAITGDKKELADLLQGIEEPKKQEESIQEHIRKKQQKFLNDVIQQIKPKAVNFVIKAENKLLDKVSYIDQTLFLIQAWSEFAITVMGYIEGETFNKRKLMKDHKKKEKELRASITEELKIIEQEIQKIILDNNKAKSILERKIKVTTGLIEQGGNEGEKKVNTSAKLELERDLKILTEEHTKNLEEKKREKEEIEKKLTQFKAQAEAEEKEAFLKYREALLAILQPKGATWTGSKSTWRKLKGIPQDRTQWPYYSFLDTLIQENPDILRKARKTFAMALWTAFSTDEKSTNQLLGLAEFIKLGKEVKEVLKEHQEMMQMKEQEKKSRPSARTKAANRTLRHSERLEERTSTEKKKPAQPESPNQSVNLQEQAQPLQASGTLLEGKGKETTTRENTSIVLPQETKRSEGMTKQEVKDTLTHLGVPLSPASQEQKKNVGNAATQKSQPQKPTPNSNARGRRKGGK